MFSLANFWFAVLVACLVWYTTVTVYVAVRGAFDIKGMLARLDKIRSSDDDAEG